MDICRLCRFNDRIGPHRTGLSCQVKEKFWCLECLHNNDAPRWHTSRDRFQQGGEGGHHSQGHQRKPAHNPVQPQLHCQIRFDVLVQITRRPRIRVPTRSLVEEALSYCLARAVLKEWKKYVSLIYASTTKCAPRHGESNQALHTAKFQTIQKCIHLKHPSRFENRYRACERTLGVPRGWGPGGGRLG